MRNSLEKKQDLYITLLGSAIIVILGLIMMRNISDYMDI